MPKISVHNLTKVYHHRMMENLSQKHEGLTYDALLAKLDPKDKVAVNDVSFDLNPGDRLGIIGRNGAGKSTLLSMLASISKPTLGKIDIDGHVTAVMTLGVGLNEDMTGRENIYLDGEIQGRSKSEIDRVIDVIVDFTELGEFIDYPVRTYSTGMKSRLAFSMLVHIEPEILIIDEALSAGDAFFATKATQAINSLCSKGKIVIIVSHSMNSITDMCNRCIWMEDGTIKQDGNPHEVTEAYLESVQQADESVYLKQMQKQSQSFSRRQGVEVYHLETTSVDSGHPSNVFKSGESLRVSVAGDAHHLSAPMLKFTVKRLDGLVLTEEKHAIQGKSFAFDIDLVPLVLANGIYQIQFDILDENEILASRSKFIEVFMLKPPAGGRTALNYPCDISLNELTVQEQQHAGL